MKSFIIEQARYRSASLMLEVVFWALLGVAKSSGSTIIKSKYNKSTRVVLFSGFRLVNVLKDHLLCRMSFLNPWPCGLNSTNWCKYFRP